MTVADLIAKLQDPFITGPAAIVLAVLAAALTHQWEGFADTTGDRMLRRIGIGVLVFGALPMLALLFLATPPE